MARAGSYGEGARRGAAARGTTALQTRPGEVGRGAAEEK